MKAIRAFLAAFFALTLLFTLTSCYQAEQVINVKPDGSGTFVLTIRMIQETKAQETENFAQMELMKRPEETADLAKRLGEGVTFVSAEKFSDGKFRCLRQTFKFSDITKLKPPTCLNQAISMLEPKTVFIAPAPHEADAPLKFQFTNGNPSTLVIQTPLKEKKLEAPDDSLEPVISLLVKPIRMTIAVNIEGSIVSTDAENKDGNRITILDIPMEEVVKDFKKFKAIAKAPDWSSAAQLMKEIPGAKAESSQR